MGIVVLLSYAGSGALLACIFYRARRAREHHAVQTAAAVVTLGGGASTLALLNSLVDSGPGLSNDVLGQGYFFLCAAICHAPTVIYTLLFQWNRLVEGLTSPGCKEGPGKDRTEREEWKLVEESLEALAQNPVNPYKRRQLAECYERLGLTDSAISEYQRTIECIHRGYEHSFLLFKTAKLLIEQNRTKRALPVLRRIIRTYPKSWFAAYARRVVNQYEAQFINES